MSRHDDRVSLSQMRDHALEDIELGEGHSSGNLAANRMLSLALTRLVQIVGEAATRVSKATQDVHPEIPWSHIIGTRNRLVHAYDQVDFDVLSETISDDLPVLVSELDRILSEESGI